MREVFRDVMLTLGVIFAGLQAYFQWRGATPIDPPIVQTAVRHPIGGLVLVAAMFIIAGILNSAPLLLRLMPAWGNGSENDEDPTELFLEAMRDKEKYQDRLTLTRIELEQLKAQKPDTSLKETDPLIEIKIADLRGKTLSDKPYDQACFDLINRGKQSPAQFVCIEDFYIGGYRIAFRNFPPTIRPFGNHESIAPLYINSRNGRLCNEDIFTVMFHAWQELNQPKLYDWPIPLKATYQDEARNLFEVRCDLVFYPQEHINRQAGGSTVAEIKNHRLRKVAPASYPINWSGPVTAFL